MKNVEVLDRSSLLSGLYAELNLKSRETAIVTIDMHRGHLDMDVATMPAKPEDAKRVIANAKRVLDFARNESSTGKATTSSTTRSAWTASTARTCASCWMP